MKGAVRVTRRNWRHFEDIVDSLTLEKYKIGDRVVRCSECSLTFHVQYLEDRFCPGCSKEFVPAQIQTKVIRMKLDKTAAKQGIRKVVLTGRRFEEGYFARIAERTLTAAGIIGLVLSCGIWTWIALNSADGGSAIFRQTIFLLENGPGNRLSQAAMMMIEPLRYIGTELAGLRGGVGAILNRYVLLADQFGQIARMIGQSVWLLLEKYSIL